MLTYSFADIGTDSLYTHLYKCIKADIAAGNLAFGTKLPSKRSLARQLNLSIITVENAYAQLLAEGYIYSIPKKGYFVSDLCQVAAGIATRSADRQVPVQKKHYIADFTSNQTRAENFPFATWTKLMRQVISENSAELMQNPPPGGVPVLRQAIADNLRQFRGIEVDKEQIIVGAGTEYLYGLLLQLLGYDKVYAVEEPGYRKTEQIYKSCGVQCRHIPVDKQGIDICQLENSGADIVHISPSHHFPTGSVTPVSRRYELLSWAAKAQSRYIIEDDYDSEFRFCGRPIPAMQSIDLTGKVIYMNTFSKTLSSTIRISYMVLPTLLMEEFQRRLGFYACTVSTFEQFTLAKFIRDGYFEKHINRMRNFYRRQRDSILQRIAESQLAPLVQIQEDDAGLHFLMQVQTDIPDSILLERAEAAGIRISCLSQYYHQAEVAPQHILVVNYSAITTQQMEEAAAALYNCLCSDE